jgi:hypothetical protein
MAQCSHIPSVKWFVTPTQRISFGRFLMMRTHPACIVSHDEPGCAALRPKSCPWDLDFEDDRALIFEGHTHTLVHSIKLSGSSTIPLNAASHSAPSAPSTTR